VCEVGLSPALVEEVRQLLWRAVGAGLAAALTRPYARHGEAAAQVRAGVAQPAQACRDREGAGVRGKDAYSYRHAHRLYYTVWPRHENAL
jgi:hypothetical protein